MFRLLKEPRLFPIDLDSAPGPDRSLRATRAGGILLPARV